MYNTDRYYSLGVYKMKRYKTIFTVLLTIFTLAFFMFVIIMQDKFNNPEFADVTSVQTANTPDKTSKYVDEEDEDTKTEDSEKEEKDTPVETTTSTRTVLVDTLNARSGPGVDYEITGVLVINQLVEVEDSGDKWVHITSNEFTGYVNEKYLSEE